MKNQRNKLNTTRQKLNTTRQKLKTGNAPFQGSDSVGISLILRLSSSKVLPRLHVIGIFLDSSFKIQGGVGNVPMS